MMIVIFVSKSGCVIFWATQGQKKKNKNEKKFHKKQFKSFCQFERNLHSRQGLRAIAQTPLQMQMLLNIASFSVFLCILSLYFETNNCFFIFQNVFSYKMIKIVRIIAICQ